MAEHPSRLCSDDSLTGRPLAAIAVIILLLAGSPQALTASQATPQQQPASPGGVHPFLNHGIELMNSSDRITLAWLDGTTHGNLTLPAFEKVIQSSLLTLGVRKVLLDVGWQNYTFGAIQEQQWVGNWLSACDALGVQNLLYLGQLTQGGYGSTWAKSLIAADPSAQTYFSDGTASPFISVDNPDVAKAIEVDLGMLYSYYGSHASWVGLGTGYPRSDPYFHNGSTMPIMGYSNATLQAFVNSPFFARDTNQTGFFGNGTGDKLWSSFKQVEPSEMMNSGGWMTSSGEPVFGSQSSGDRVAMRFFLPENESEMQLSWYGDKVGQAGDLVAQLVHDENGSLLMTANATVPITQSASDIIATVGWQPGIRFTGSFSTGNYWVVFSSPSSDSKNYVSVYMRDYRIGSFVAYYQQGGGKQIGYTVLWIRDGKGTDLQIYPYQNAYVPSRAQTFVASQSFSFNTVFLFLSDRHYDPTNGTLIITDITRGHSVEATGVLSQALTHGLLNWTPIELDKVVTTVPGDNYSISITEPQNGYSWIVVVRGVTVDPPEIGFQGQASSWLFRLDLMNWSQPHLSYSVITSNGADYVRSGHPDAIRFSPSQDETLQSIGLLMKNLDAANPSYASGSLTLGVWNSSLDGSQPSTKLAAVNITAPKIPENGWLNASGLHQPLVGGDYYWLVISTDSNAGFTLSRLTSPYESSVKVSYDGGRTWSLPTEGPSEYSYILTLSKETLGPAVSDVSQVQLSETSEFGQPIQVSEATQVKGVYIGVFDRERSTAPNDHIVVSIHPDNGKGKPSQTALASGIYYGDNITFYSPDYIQFTSVARLESEQTYWIVIQPVGGSYYVSPDVYLSRAPAASTNAMVSNDAGFSWQRYSNNTTTLSYMLASPIQPSPTFDTKQLYLDLEKFHHFPIDTVPLKGWSAYVQFSELAITNDVASWLNKQTGRSWEVAVSAQPSVLEEANYTAITPLPANNQFASCADAEQYLLTKAPVSNTQFYDVGNLELLAHCTSFSMSSFAQVLSYLQSYPSAGSSGNASSTLWQTEAVTGQSPDLYYSLGGRTGGPIIVWVSNAGQTAANFSLSLNATQLGLRDQWVVLGLNDSRISTGAGRSIQLQKEIPAQSWYPIIVGSYNGSFVASYADATIHRQLQYPNQGLYSTGSPVNQTVLLLISSASPVGGVLVDSKNNLTNVAGPSFYSSHEGWYYDSGSGILLVKFQSSGDDTVRVLSASPPVVHPTPVPTTTIAEALAVLFLVNVTIVLYLAIAGRGGGRNAKMAARQQT